MQAGNLRHRLVIQRLVAGSPSQDAAGAPDSTWTDYITVYADIRPVTGKEPFLAQAHLSILRQGLESADAMEANDFFGQVLVSGDFNGDGIIDFSDFAILAENFG